MTNIQYLHWITTRKKGHIAYLKYLSNCISKLRNLRHPPPLSLYCVNSRTKSYALIPFLHDGNIHMLIRERGLLHLEEHIRRAACSHSHPYDAFQLHSLCYRDDDAPYITSRGTCLTNCLYQFPPIWWIQATVMVLQNIKSTYHIFMNMYLYAS